MSNATRSEQEAQMIVDYAHNHPEWRSKWRRAVDKNPHTAMREIEKEMVEKGLLRGDHYVS